MGGVCNTIRRKEAVACDKAGGERCVAGDQVRRIEVTCDLSLRVRVKGHPCWITQIKKKLRNIAGEDPETNEKPVDKEYVPSDVTMKCVRIHSYLFNYFPADLPEIPANFCTETG